MTETERPVSLKYFPDKSGAHLDQVEVGRAEMRHSGCVTRLPGPVVGHGEEDLGGSQVVLQLSAIQR